MVIIINLLFFLLLLFKKSTAYNEFDRLPTPPVDYRYFAEVDPTYKILGSCTEVNTTAPMSRCILQIVHKYKTKYLPSTSVEEQVGTGIVIYKSTENDKSYIIILTAFHIVIPQLNLSLLTFVIISFSTICLLSAPILICYLSVVYQHLCKILFGFIPYIIICSCLTYHVLLVIYPFLFNSSFQITLLSDTPISNRSELSQIHCELISSKIVLSYTWLDDIGLLKCSNIQTNTFRYIEECKPILDNFQSISHTSINVIGYVDRSPLSFDLIIDPFFSSLTPLWSIDSVDGETPSDTLHPGKFMNCTGNVRLIDGRKIYIDTPTTYGFSGGPCFITSTSDGWSFHGILSSASRLWNVCISLKESKVFVAYYNELIKIKRPDNLKNDL